MKWFFRLFFTLLLLIGWLVVGYLYVDYTLETPKHDKPITIEIPPNSSIQEIGTILKKENLIRDNRFFRLYTRITGRDEIVAGVYEIQPDQDLRSILEKLEKGKQDLVKVAIPEGKTIYDIAGILEQAGYDKEAFLKEVDRQEPKTEIEKQIIDNPKRTFKLEGYLFPLTYEFRKEATAEEIVTTMVKEFEEHWKKINGPKLIMEQKKSLDEIVTIASLIEKEAKSAEDQPPIAGVIYNRIGIKMQLQIDAATIYAHRTQGRVLEGNPTYKDLEINSAYNLYIKPTNKEYQPQIQPLPPGAIANPGEGALQAALHPEKNKYIYYIVDKVNPSVHQFFETYDQFLRYKNSK